MFVVTKEYQRFTEFLDAVRRDRYIGLCYGPPGVGKTLSARHYADWDSVHPYLQRRQRGLERYPSAIAPARLDCSCTVVWTPPVVIAPTQLHQQVLGACTALDEAIQERHRTEWRRRPAFRFPYVELLVVDEADRLKTTALETLRDLYDRTALGLVLIGMPGMQRRLARYPQLYSRVGFAHEFRALATDEVTSVVTNHWRELGLQVPSGEFNDPEAIAAVVRTTGGNFRLIQRLFAQITRILDVNQMDVVTKDVVEAARGSLIIGPP